MIEYEPTFPAPYKRKVAILKAQNKISDALTAIKNKEEVCEGVQI